jgi:hypothetical protein
MNTQQILESIETDILLNEDEWSRSPQRAYDYWKMRLEFGAELATTGELPAGPQENAQYFVHGPEGLDDVADLDAAEKFIRDNYMEDGDLHPDIEDIMILKQVGSVSIEETGGEIERHGELVPVCKVSIHRYNESTPVAPKEERR